jgi:hypothetical protein
MENFDFQYVLLALLGMVIHITMNVLQRRNNKNEISIKYFFSDFYNWVRIFLVLVSIATLFLMADDVANILGITLTDGSPARSVFAFLCGYLNHSIIKNLLKVVKK